MVAVPQLARVTRNARCARTRLVQRFSSTQGVPEMRSLSILLIVAAALVLGSCGKKTPTVPDESGSTAVEGSGTGTTPGEGQVGEGRDLPGASGSPTGGPAGV